MQRTPNTCIDKQMSHIAYTAVQEPCHASCVKYPPPYYTMNPESFIEYPTFILNPACCIMRPAPCIPYATFAPQPCYLTPISCRFVSYIPPFICFDMWITQCPNTRIGRYIHDKHTQKVALHALHINTAARLMSHECHVTNYTSYGSSYRLESLSSHGIFQNNV
jgi:hypothetical protein